MKNVIISLPRSGSSSLGSIITKCSSKRCILEVDERCPVSKWGHKLVRPCDIRNLKEYYFKIIVHFYSDDELKEIITENRCLFLYRKNIFKLALSMCVYKKFQTMSIPVSQKYYTFDGVSIDDFYNTKITISREDIDKNYRIYTRQFKRMMKMRKLLSPDSPVFSYEHIYYQDKESSIKEIMNYFDIDDLDIDCSMNFLKESNGKLNTYENIKNIEEIMSWENEYERVQIDE